MARLPKLLLLCSFVKGDVNVSFPRLLANRNYEFAHEGPVWIPGTDTLLFTSFRLHDDTRTLADESSIFVEISTVNLRAFNDTSPLDTELWSQTVTGGNGAFVGRNGLVYILSQGNFHTPGGIFTLDPHNGFAATPVTQSVSSDVACQYTGHTCSGRPVTFNSLNDIVEDHQSGALIFSDPEYGWIQGFRAQPGLGNYLWIRHTNGTQRVLDMDYGRPNGMCFDGITNTTLYTTDTAYEWGDGTKDPGAPNAIYKYRVLRDGSGEILGLADRSLFAGIPGDEMDIADGIKVDVNTGYVFAGLGNGVGVWEDTGNSGRMLQLITMPQGEGVANFALVPQDDKTLLVTMCDRSIYVTEISKQRLDPLVDKHAMDVLV